MQLRQLFLLAAVALTGLASCQDEARLRVEDGWVRLPAAPGRPAAAYFTVQGGAQPTRLVSVTSPVVIRTELHDTMKGQHSMMQMRQIEGGVDIPAGGTVRFEPGGKHVMLFNVNPGIVPGKFVTFSFTFADGTQIGANLPARAAGDPAP